MKLFGSKKELLTGGVRTAGVVTEAKECRWLKINTKPVRTCSADGARYPHAVSFRFEADGNAYTGRVRLGWEQPRPAVGQAVTVYYRADDPADCTAVL